MKKEELIKILEEEGATESALAETGCVYAFCYVGFDDGTAGRAVILIEEGFLSIPFDIIIPSAGYEQLLLDRAAIITKKDLESFIEDTESALGHLKRMATM